jgi:lipoate-protein ligase A
MHCIVSPTTDPVFNLAAEEYLFRNFVDDVLFLYINTPSVVVGKHQNAIAEINPLYIHENDIPIVRRMSGGGAVYHDRGNLNFSFHKTVDDTAKVRYSEFSKPIVEVLHDLGIPAEINSRNDIIVSGFKVSGHAQHVFRNRVLSHGTLLVNSDLTKLSASLKRSTGRFESRAIQSVRSPVTNVSDFSTESITATHIITLLLERIGRTNPGTEFIKLSSQEIREIETLAYEKYSTREWNYGYSPLYFFRNEIETREGEKLNCCLSVDKGIIFDAKIEGTLISPIDLYEFEQQLCGLCHMVKPLRELISITPALNDHCNDLIQLLF